MSIKQLIQRRAFIQSGKIYFRNKADAVRKLCTFQINKHTPKASLVRNELLSLNFRQELHKKKKE